MSWFYLFLLLKWNPTFCWAGTFVCFKIKFYIWQVRLCCVYYIWHIHLRFFSNNSDSSHLVTFFYLYLYSLFFLSADSETVMKALEIYMCSMPIQVSVDWSEIFTCAWMLLWTFLHTRWRYFLGNLNVFILRGKKEIALSSCICYGSVRLPVLT